MAVSIRKSTLCDSSGVFTRSFIKKDETITHFRLGRLGAQGNHSLQIDFGVHTQEPDGAFEFINHSCNPNCYVDKELRLVALRNIKVNEELSYDYCTTEYDLEDVQFSCDCKSKNCRGQIKGFKYLSDNEKARLRPYLAPYLRGEPIKL